MPLQRNLLDDWQRTLSGQFLSGIAAYRPGRRGCAYLHKAVNLAGLKSVPVVASNDVHFLKASDFDAHEARVCINEGRTLDDPRRSKEFTEQQYLRSAEEMQALFSDIPEALENTVEIARRCNLELELGKNYLPDFPVPEGMDMAGYFKQQAEQGWSSALRKFLTRTGGY